MTLAETFGLVNVAIGVASVMPAVRAAIIGVVKSAKAVIKARKAEKIASLAAKASRMTKNAANTLQNIIMRQGKNMTNIDICETHYF